MDLALALLERRRLGRMYTYVRHKDPHETSIAVVVAVERVIEILRLDDIREIKPCLEL